MATAVAPPDPNAIQIEEEEDSSIRRAINEVRDSIVDNQWQEKLAQYQEALNQGLAAIAKAQQEGVKFVFTSSSDVAETNFVEKELLNVNIRVDRLDSKKRKTTRLRIHVPPPKVNNSSTELMVHAETEVKAMEDD